MLVTVEFETGGNCSNWRGEVDVGDTKSMCFEGVVVGWIVVKSRGRLIEVNPSCSK